MSQFFQDLKCEWYGITYRAKRKKFNKAIHKVYKFGGDEYSQKDGILYIIGELFMKEWEYITSWWELEEDNYNAENRANLDAYKFYKTRLPKYKEQLRLIEEKRWEYLDDASNFGEYINSSSSDLFWDYQKLSYYLSKTIYDLEIKYAIQCIKNWDGLIN